MQDIKIYVTDLAQYNNWKLVGERVTLNDIDSDELKAILSKYWEETFISDFEAPFKIWEYDSPFDLLEQIEYMDTLTEEELVIYLFVANDNWGTSEYSEDTVRSWNYSLHIQSSRDDKPREDEFYELHDSNHPLFSFVDWNQVEREFKMEYSEFEYNDTTYWISIY